MQDIIAAASALGKQIGAHPRSQAFLEAAKAVAADQEAQGVLKDYQTLMARLRQLEEGGQPIEAGDKRALATAQERVAGNELLKQMMRTQADYLEMVTQVHRAIDAAAYA